MKIGDLFIKLGLKKDEFDRGLTDAKTQTNVFGNSIKKIGGLIAGAFAADKIIQFGKELLTLASQSEGVVVAFNKIAQYGDLENLRNSVKGTVSDLELMKRAVQANNFGIPVRELGILFEFASKRAQDTGQSVDYLVDSIVLGIGRKSPLILDNLGISAVQLKEKLHGVGMESASVADITKAVGDIAEESFAKTGRFADNLGTKITNLSVKWENFKLSLVQNEGFKEFWNKEIDELDKNLTILFSKHLTKWQKFKSIIDIFGNETDYLYNKAKLSESIDKWINQPEMESSGAPWEKPKQDHVVKTAQERLAELKKLNEEMEAARILRKEFYGEKMTHTTPLYSGAGDFMLQQPGVNLEGTFGNLDSHYKMVLEKQKKFRADYLSEWNTLITDLNDVINQGLENAIASFAEGIGQLATGEISGREFGNQVLKVIGDFMKTLGSLMIAYAINMALFSESAKNPLSWPVALAAGVGMVAAGAAISSLAGKGLKSSASSAAGYSSSSAYRPANSNTQMALTGNVVFELEGTKLIGAINNTNKRNNLIR